MIFGLSVCNMIFAQIFLNDSQLCDCLATTPYSTTLNLILKSLRAHWHQRIIRVRKMVTKDELFVQ